MLRENELRTTDASEASPLPPPAPPPPPTEMLTREQAAQFLGVPGGTLIDWVRTGKVTFWLWFYPPRGGQRRRVYPRDAIEELARRRADRTFPPSGFVTVDEGCRILGVASRTWYRMESDGELPLGEWITAPGKTGRCKVYPKAELERVVAETKRREEEEIIRLAPYPDPDRPGCWRVPLVSGLHDGMEAIVDAESLPLVRGKRWWWTPGPGGGNGSVVEAVSSCQNPLRQLIMGVRRTGVLVTHVNGDHLDYRRANLVVRTHAESKAASRKALMRNGRAASSKYKGVSWDPNGHKWVVSIKSEARNRKLGRFISEIDAALTYDAAAREVYGQHARLNFTDPTEAARLRGAEPQLPREIGLLPPPGFADTDEACLMLGLSLVTWTAWAHLGRLPVKGYECERAGGGRWTLYHVEELNSRRDDIKRLGQPYPASDRAGCYRVPIKSLVCYREAIIDAESLALVEPYEWYWSPRHGGRGHGRVVLLSENAPYPLRAPLARVLTGVAAAGMMTRVSHRNDDPLDCRLDNLIVRTFQEQMFNCRKTGSRSGRKCTSVYKGVCWIERLSKWVVHIQKDGRQCYLGLFRDEVAAAEKYDEAARELFGEHARLNFPDGIDAALARDTAAVPREAA